MSRPSRGFFPSFFRIPALFSALGAFVLLGGLQGCSVYYNTYFNAEKSYEQAVQLRGKRLELNPEDSVNVSADEKAKLQRAIVKASKVLELWPDNRKYAPKAVFLIAESYLLMGDYDQAAPKYAEFIRYFPKDEKIPLARAHRVKALYLSGQKFNAREELEALLATNPAGEARREALLLSAQMQVDENSGAQGLAVYEKLLDEGAFNTPDARAEAHWQAARIAFDLKQWQKARSHALAPEIDILPPRQQYRNHKLAVLCLYEMGRFDEGIAETRSLSRDKKYRLARPELMVLEARGQEAKKDWASAEVLYHRSIAASNRTATGSEGLYRIGLHFWNVPDQEDSARIYFDSAATYGRDFEFGALGEAKGRALGRIRELRAPDTTRADSLKGHDRDFSIAEIFLLDLNRPDSARVHLNRIVASPKEDSVYSRRAFYALAYLEADSGGSKARSDSLYRAVLTRYPGTEWAKQAEKNLGMPSTVQTPEDKAHQLFLEAERRRFAGENVTTSVIPAYRAVATTYPSSSEAAKALFVVAFLKEDQALAATPPSGVAIDSAKSAYEAVSKAYPGTVYADKATDKLQAAGDGPVSSSHGSNDDGAEESGEDTGDKKVIESVDPRGEEDLY